MRKVNIVTIVGARPQFVKASAVSRALAAAGAFDERLVHTGQHFDDAMSAIFFRELGTPAPSVNLGVANAPHGAMTGRMLEAIEAYLAPDLPDAALVYGDTNSTLAGALAATKLGVPVIHCEAGLRSFRPHMAEEVNRVVVDHVSALLLAPTREAARNLEREGLAARSRIIGDVMFDVTLAARDRAREGSAILERLSLAPGGYDVLTLHRAENTDNAGRLEALLDYLAQTACVRPVVFPIHPRTAKAIGPRQIANVVMTGPLGYLDFHRLLADCAVVHTDSGGVQKEAYFHRKPCVTLRDETEWVETIAAGWNRLWTQDGYAAPRRDIPDYGDGRAAERAVAEIAAFFTPLPYSPPLEKGG